MSWNSTIKKHSVTKNNNNLKTTFNILIALFMLGVFVPDSYSQKIDGWFKAGSKPDSYDWSKYEIVLDVAPETIGIAYGFLVHGTGNTWFSGFNIETVGSDVPTTDMTK